MERRANVKTHATCEEAWPLMIATCQVPPAPQACVKKLPGSYLGGHFRCLPGKARAAVSLSPHVDRMQTSSRLGLD